MAAQLVVTVNDAGAVNVTGPIDDLILCLGLLEAGKVSLIDYARAKAERAGGVQSVAPGQGDALMQALARRGLNGGTPGR